MLSPSVSLDSSPYRVLYCLHIVLATSAVTLNSLVAVAILTNRSLRAENRFLYILNTCLADFTLGAGWFYVGLFDISNSPLAMITCRLLLYDIMGVIFLSILSSQCELYFAVAYPFQYMRSMTKSRTVGILVFCWVFPSIMTFIYGLFEDSTSTFKGISNIVSNFCVFIIMFGLNIKLYLIAKSQQEREHSGTQDTKKSSLRLIIVVSFTFLLLWTPATANECICSLCTCRIFERDAINPFSILIVVASVVNPILYLCGSRAVRAAMWKTKVPCTFCKRNINPQNQEVEKIPGAK